MKKLIDADALERDGWHMYRTVKIDEKTMEWQTRKPTDFPTVEPQPEQKWIPVTEALPDAGAEVWVTIKGHDVIKCKPGETIEQAVDRISKIRWVTRGYWSEDEHAWNDPSYGCPLMVQPIAWMPIDTPEPWKGR